MRRIYAWLKRKMGKNNTSPPIDVFQVVGMLIKEAARGIALKEYGLFVPVSVEVPPIGALVVEATTMWGGKVKREAVGWVERIDSEDGKPIDRFNARVVLRLLDPDNGDPLQPWINASFYVAPEQVGLSFS